MKRFRNHLPVVVRPQALLGAVLLASLAACAGRSGGGASSTPPPPDNTVSTPSAPSATPTGDAAQRFQQSGEHCRVLLRLIGRCPPEQQEVGPVALHPTEGFEHGLAVL